MDTSHENLVLYNPSWNEKYEAEILIIKPLFGEDLISIEHIGSTAIPSISAKPIIDIGVLLKSHENADKYIEVLKEYGYNFDTIAHAKGTAPERHFLRKGDPTTFHLSLAYADRGSFWERQLLFRDYLREHPEAAREYQQVKENGMDLDPSGGNGYIESKTEFIDKILDKAGFVKNW